MINSSAWIGPLPLHIVGTYSNTFLILVAYERQGADFLYWPHETKSVIMKQILLPWNIFLPHETYSAPIKQSGPRETVSFYPRYCKNPLISCLISEDIFSHEIVLIPQQHTVCPRKSVFPMRAYRMHPWNCIIESGILEFPYDTDFAPNGTDLDLWKGDCMIYASVLYYNAMLFIYISFFIFAASILGFPKLNVMEKSRHLFQDLIRGR